MDPLTQMGVQAVGTAIIRKIFEKAWKTATGAPGWIKDQLEKRDPFGIEAAKYAEHIASRHDSMRIIGMDRSVPLNDIYIQVNIRDRQSEYQNFDAEFLEWRESQGATQNIVQYAERAVSAVRAVEKHPKVMVLGRPGAGKTTFLKYLAISSLDEKFTNDLLPIFVSLKEWSQQPGRKLETLIIQQFDVCGLGQTSEFVKKLLRDGRCIVLLDGFDEIDPAHKDSGITQIESVVRNYPNNHYVVSCRTAANTYVFPDFTEVEIADFNDTQIEKFVRKWFERAMAARCVKELHSPEHAALLDLARSPLLLTLICIAYLEAGSFPENRVGLYETALDALLRKWDASRQVVRENQYKQLTVPKKELLLSKIASYGFEQSIDLYDVRVLSDLLRKFMQEHAPVEDFNAENILDAVEAQHGIMVKERKGEYKFSHLTFQEFYTARAIVSSPDATLLSKVLFLHMGDPRWNEVLLIGAGLQHDATRYVYELKVALDRLRTADVEQVIAIARTAVKDNNSFPPVVNVALALTYLLKEVSHRASPSTLRGIVSFTDLTARRICTLGKIKLDPESAMFQVTQMGDHRHRASMEQLVQQLAQFKDSWAPLHKYFVGMHILLGCLAGEATVPATFRDKVVAQLFLPGPTEPPTAKGELLFS